jgi:hypothetical protein
MNDYEIRYIPVTREFLDKLLDGLVCGYPVTWFGKAIDWDHLLKKEDVV